MIDIKRKPFAELISRWLSLLALASGLILVAMGCGSSDTVIPEPETEDASTPRAVVVLPTEPSTPASTPDIGATVEPVVTPIPPPATSYQSAHQPPSVGAAPPTLEARIYYSDIIVRARQHSEGKDYFIFKVIEYLKGIDYLPGESLDEIPVRLNPDFHDRNWDAQEAVLF